MSEPARVLLVHNRYRHVGGEERAVDNLERLLSDHGHKTEFLEADSRTWADRPFWELPRQAAEVIYSGSSASRLRGRIAAFKPDIVHVHNVFPVLSPSVYETAAAAGCKVVQTVHNYRFMCANGLFLTPQNDRCERCKGGWFHNAVRLGCYQESRIRSIPIALSLTWHRQRRTFQKNISAFIAPSQFIKQKLIEASFPAERIHVIPNVHLGWNDDVADQPRSAFVFVGRLSREKGLWVLLEAFAKTPKQTLKIIGDGPLARPLRQAIEERSLGNIECLGALTPDQVKGWMHKARALILPSECYENQPQVVLEAWGVRTPVIVSRLGGLAELVEDGKTGWLFPAGDSDALGRLINAIPGDALADAGNAGHQRAKQRFAPESVYPAIKAVYEMDRSERRAKIESAS